MRNAIRFRGQPGPKSRLRPAPGRRGASLQWKRFVCRHTRGRFSAIGDFALADFAAPGPGLGLPRPDQFLQLPEVAFHPSRLEAERIAKASRTKARG